MAPYREAPRSLGCPRCGERLEEALEGVQACTRCAGLWIENAVLEIAFGTPRWPPGASAWWRVELACPMCALEGKANDLVPFVCGDVLVDRCSDHGLWLDAGELGRLMNEPASEELEALRRKLGAPADVQAQLVARREAQRRQWQARAMEARSARDRVAALEAELASLHERIREIEQQLIVARRDAQ